MTITLERPPYKLERPELIDEIIRKPNLLLDLDGVVVEYDFPKLVKDFFHVDLISKYMIYAYDLADVLGVTSIAIDTMFREQVWGEPHFIDGALEVLRELDYEIVIFSNRLKYMGRFELTKWLIDWQIPFNSICEEGEGQYDIQIDDRPSKLRDTNSKLKLLYSQNWNLQCLNIERALKRVYNWQEIKEICNGH